MYNGQNTPENKVYNGLWEACADTKSYGMTGVTLLHIKKSKLEKHLCSHYGKYVQFLLHIGKLTLIHYHKSIELSAKRRGTQIGTKASP